MCSSVSQSVGRSVGCVCVYAARIIVLPMRDAAHIRLFDRQPAGRRINLDVCVNLSVSISPPLLLLLLLFLSRKQFVKLWRGQKSRDESSVVVVVVV